MPTLIFNVVGWPTLGIALLVFGFAPGAVMRLIILAFKRDDPRRRELLAELHAVPRVERPFWVAEQLEIAVFEGLRGRLATWRIKRKIRVAKKAAIAVGDAASSVRDLTTTIADLTPSVFAKEVAVLNFNRQIREFQAGVALRNSLTDIIKELGPEDFGSPPSA
jgi:hypothetical protein